jgi:hypothetical protein
MPPPLLTYCPEGSVPEHDWYVMAGGVTGLASQELPDTPYPVEQLHWQAAGVPVTKVQLVVP